MVSAENETDSAFWHEVDDLLSARAEFLPELMSENSRAADQSAYEGNLAFFRTLIELWARELQDRSFIVVSNLAAPDGLKLAYCRRGFRGYGGFASWRNFEGRIVMARVGPENPNELQWPADPEECVPLGIGFDESKFVSYVRYSLQTFLDESNIVLTPRSWEKLRHHRFAKFQSEFESLKAERDRSKAGKCLELLLDRLFTLEGLAPRGSFRIEGEEIDGSFLLDHEVYLLEAKWKRTKVTGEDLAYISEKIERKSRFTRGVLISIGEVSEGAVESLLRRPPLFFIMTGEELAEIFRTGCSLADYLRSRQRILCEEGKALRSPSQ